MNQELVDMAMVAIRNELKKQGKVAGRFPLTALDIVRGRFPGYFQVALQQLVDRSLLTFDGGRFLTLTEEGSLWLLR